MRINADGDGRSSAALEEPEATAPPAVRTLTRAERIRAMRALLESESRPQEPAPPAPEARVAPEPRRSTVARRAETRDVLHTLDEIAEAFAPRSTSLGSDAFAPALEPGETCDPRGARGRALWGEPSPYLEERMGGARNAVADLGRALEEISARSDDLRGTVATLEEQLHQAAREIKFLRHDEAVPTPMPLPATPVGAAQATATRVRTKAPAAVAATAAPSVAEASSAPFAQYTTEKYNRSVGVLANQRTRIGTTMIVLAAAISAVLLVVTFLSHEPTPSAFVAGLPVIWMIPVPFFVISFRGTQRVLRTNPMSLEGGF